MALWKLICNVPGGIKNHKIRYHRELCSVPDMAEGEESEVFDDEVSDDARMMAAMRLDRTTLADGDVVQTFTRVPADAAKKKTKKTKKRS